MRILIFGFFFFIPFYFLSAQNCSNTEVVKTFYKKLSKAELLKSNQEVHIMLDFTVISKDTIENSNQTSSLTIMMSGNSGYYINGIIDLYWDENDLLVVNHQSRTIMVKQAKKLKFDELVSTEKFLVDFVNNSSIAKYSTVKIKGVDFCKISLFPKEKMNVDQVVYLFAPNSKLSSVEIDYNNSHSKFSKLISRYKSIEFISYNKSFSAKSFVFDADGKKKEKLKSYRLI